MFFLLAVLAMLGYSVYGTLIAHHVRAHDGLSVAIVRNLGLIITMSPLLLLAEPGTIQRVPEFLPTLLIAASTGAIGLTLGLWSLKFLPVGIRTAFGRMFSVLLMFGAGLIWFGEVPTAIELVLAGVLIFGIAGLSLQKSITPTIDSRSWIGILLTLLSAIVTAVAFTTMSQVARDLDPFVAGYMWEGLIGVVALLFGLIRWIGWGTKIAENINWHEIGRITLVSWPTLLGTGAFGLAVTLGPIGVANAIGSSGIFVATILGGWLYHEKMTHRQWLWIGICILGLIGFALLS